MKRILLPTLGISFLVFLALQTPGELDGRYAGSPLHDWSIVS